MTLALEKFPNLFRSAESRYFNPIADYWCASEVYFVLPTGKRVQFRLSPPPREKLSYRLLGASLNELKKGDIGRGENQLGLTIPYE